MDCWVGSSLESCRLNILIVGSWFSSVFGYIGSSACTKPPCSPWSSIAGPGNSDFCTTDGVLLCLVVLLLGLRNWIPYWALLSTPSLIFYSLSPFLLHAWQNFGWVLLWFVSRSWLRASKFFFWIKPGLIFSHHESLLFLVLLCWRTFILFRDFGDGLIRNVHFRALDHSCCLYWSSSQSHILYWH